MKKKRLLKKLLIVLIAAALAVSLSWSYRVIKPLWVIPPVEKAVIVVTPNYHILSQKKLSLWPTGTQFSKGMAGYFYAANPSFELTPLIRLSGLKQGELNGEVSTKVELRTLTEKSQVYWSYTVLQTPHQTFTFSQNASSADQPLTFKPSPLKIDVPDANARLIQIGKELQFEAGIYQSQLLATTTVHLKGHANGIEILQDIVQSLPIVLQPTYFSVPLPEDTKVQMVFTPTVPPRSMLQLLTSSAKAQPLPFAVSAALFLLLLILLLLGRQKLAKAALEHHRFKEWITEGSVEVKDRFSINILTLEGLVDLAIDLDKRVIYDNKIRKYFVMAEDMAYIHDPDRSSLMLENRQQLGKLLLERGLLKPEQLETGLYHQQRLGTRLGESLMALGFIDETTLYSTLASQQKVDYFELSPTEVLKNTLWLEHMDLKKARVLQALPLGQRADGRWVIVCAEPTKEGVQKALQELFGPQIVTVATRPSAIYEALERLDAEERARSSFSGAASNVAAEPFRRLSQDEHQQFKASYYRGYLQSSFLLKASGLVDPILLSQAPDEETLLTWLVTKGALSGDMANLVKGLSHAISDLEWQFRKEHQTPSLLDLMEKAHYLSPSTLEWAKLELAVQDLPIDQLLSRNHLVSEKTLSLADQLLSTLENLLNRSISENT